MLSDALLPDPAGSRAKGLRLELPSDRVVKFVTVGLPLFLVSLAFAREFSLGKLEGGVLGWFEISVGGTQGRSWVCSTDPIGLPWCCFCLVLVRCVAAAWQGQGVRLHIGN